MKRALVLRFRKHGSAHLSEALAAAGGFRTHAALSAPICRAEPRHADFVLLDEAASMSRLEQLSDVSLDAVDRHMLFDDLPIEGHGDVLNTRPGSRRAWKRGSSATG